MKRSLLKMLIVLVVAFLITLGSVSTVLAKETQCYMSGCTRKKQTSSSYCDYHYNQKYGNKKSTYSGKKSSSKSTSKKTSSSNSKKSYSMPDPDDYEDYEDFMDNWDGYMPGGIDAEDYWENW